MVERATIRRVVALEVKEDWKPEIEHIKGSDLRKKYKKKKDDHLPPHLRGDAIGKMKKAFSNTNETTDQFKRSLKDELLGRANKAHKEAKKKKTFKDFQKSGVEAKKRVRFYDKKGSGYIKDGKKRYD